MIRALWYFIQLCVVAGAAIWLASRPGAVDIAWQDYTLSVQLGAFLLAFVVLVILMMAIFKVIGLIVGLPGRYKNYRGLKAREKGYQSLTRGFVALAAGDAKKATQYAKEVRHLIPHETGLPLLLEAQAARLRGEEELARHSFEELLQDKDAAFFGVRGLLKSSLDSGDYIAALEYARTAMEKNPKQPWIVKSVYDLEIKNQQWHNAYQTLAKVRKFKAMDEAQAKSDEIALLLIMADDDAATGKNEDALKKVERAVRLDPGFVPAVTHLAELYWNSKRRPRIASLIETAWRLNPHPGLAVWWDKVAPENKTDDSMRRLRWQEKLVAIHPQNPDAQISAAMVAIEDGLWGEARAHLAEAEKARPSAQIFRLRSRLEEVSTHDQKRAKELLEMASEAPADPVWYCKLTGIVYHEWSPIALPHGGFNTIVWGHPVVVANQNQVTGGFGNPLLIEKI